MTALYNRPSLSGLIMETAQLTPANSGHLLVEFRGPAAEPR